MAIIYVAPATGADPSDPFKHPVNGSNTGTGPDRMNPVTWDRWQVIANDGDTIRLVASRVPIVLPLPNIAFNGAGNGTLPVTVGFNGNITIEAESKGPQTVDPYGDGRSDYSNRFERLAIIAGIVHFGNFDRNITLRNIRFTTRNWLISRFPDTTANENWDAVFTNWASLSNNINQRAILRVQGARLVMDGCEIDGGYGPNLAQDFDINTKYPDYNSAAWGDSTIYPYNNLSQMPSGLAAAGARSLTLTNNYVHDVQTAFSLQLATGAGSLITYNNLKRCYGDFIQVSYNSTLPGEYIQHGNILEDAFGHENDNYSPHADGIQHYASGLVAANYTDDNPLVFPNFISYNNISVMRGRAFLQRIFNQGAVTPGFPNVYEYISSRNDITVGALKAMDVGQARYAEANRMIALNPRDTVPAVRGNNTAQLFFRELTPARVGGPQFMERSSIDMVQANTTSVPLASKKLRRVNSVVPGDMGGIISHDTIFSGTITFAANQTVGAWWNALRPRTAYSQIGPAGYSSLYDFLYEDGSFAAAPFPPRLAVTTVEDVPTNTLVTSDPAKVVANTMPSAFLGVAGDVLPLVAPAGLSWLQMAVAPFRAAIATTGTFTLTAHGYVNGTKLRVVGQSTPLTGINTTAEYFVVNAAANTFQLAATSGGTAITGVHTAQTAQYAYITTPANITQDWLAGNGNATAGSWIMYKATSSSTAALPTVYNATIGGQSAAWTVTTASANVWPNVAWANTNKLKKDAFGAGLTDTQQGWVYICVSDTEPGVGKTLMGAVTGFAAPLTISVGTGNTIDVRLWNVSNVAQATLSSGAAYTRDGTPMEFIVAWDLSRGTTATDTVRAFTRQGAGGWKSASNSSATGAGPVGWSYTANPVYIMGNNSVTSGITIHAFVIGDDLLDLWTDPTSVLAKIKPDWAGKFFKGWTGNRPLVAFVGRTADLNQTNPVNYGRISGWTRANAVDAATAGTSQQWPVPLTLISSVDQSSTAPYVDGTTVNILVRPIGYAEPFNATPNGTGVTGSAALIPEGSDGGIVQITMTGPAFRNVGFTNDSGLHTNPPSLTVPVQKNWQFTVSNIPGYPGTVQSYLPILP